MPPSLTVQAAWPLYLGMTIAAAAAVVASASTLAELARTAGWVGWTPWLLPAALDVGGSAGGWCWLRPGAPTHARSFGRLVALVGAAGTLVGNGAGHLIAAGYVDPGPLLVVLVGAVPAAVLVALAHLAALLASPAATGAVLADRSGDAAVVTPAVPTSTPLLHERTEDRIDDPGDVDPDTADTRAAVLHAVTQRPSTIADLVRATARSRTTVVGHLTALCARGTVARGDDRRYRAVTALAQPVDPAQG